MRFSYQVFEQYLLDEVLGGVHPISVSMKQFTDHDTFKMTYREDVTWSELCNKLNCKEPQQRIPENIKIEFGDIRSATEAKKALATAIGYIRAGRALLHCEILDISYKYNLGFNSPHFF